MISDELRPFFWDVDGDQFDPRQFPHYTIGRILELGTDAAVAWLKETFAEEEIKRVVREDRPAFTAVGELLGPDLWHPQRAGCRPLRPPRRSISNPKMGSRVHERHQ